MLNLKKKHSKLRPKEFVIDDLKGSNKFNENVQVKISDIPKK
jgi:hypothetical protein